MVRQGDPLEDGTGHHDLEGLGHREQPTELLHRPLDEALVRRGPQPGLRQQAGLGVEADDLPVGDERSDDRREVA
jgi:hypothetical protein